MRKRWSIRLRAALVAFAAACAVFSLIGQAVAQTRVCRDLEAQLANFSAGGGSPRQARQYERAIEQQRAQIAKAEAQSRRANCGGGFFSRGDPARVCQSLSNTLDRMQANLASLERKHRQLGGGGSRAERANILAAIDRNGCRERQASARERQMDGGRGGGNLFDQLFKARAAQDRSENESRRFPLEDEGRRRIVVRRGNLIEVQPRVSGTFRTLCVRTCDGYFFPVAYSSHADDLDRDAAACSAMCPGTEVELYMHRTPGEETNQMISMSGVPYTELPTAFRYREAGYQRPPGCGCSAATRSFSIIAGETAPPMSIGPVPLQEPVVPRPAARPDPAADPETLANLQGGLDAAAIRKLLGGENSGSELTASVSAPTTLPPVEERRIRVVGPSFLPDPEAAIDLRAPAPNPVP
ncbi:DUF2865 domain-containing protein [Aquibium oceanicum]|uniref:DUF2865 domain-containing protein n=1 Tax=Aquibium oceanicum TaxID=1670800 RepID=A0A1L3SSB8_9HYPH|nr:DUF2865 domain-containing protein [Aquibium oceanicum]APH72288.1 hypothetical protein BSQ44_13635 [Aquibium oceanicum]